MRTLLIRYKSLLVVILGSAVWSLTMIKSGLTYSYGMGFWGPNGHDGIWHLALIESLSQGNFQMPIFSGEIIKNYHLGFDLLLTFFRVVTQIPTTILYFQAFPILVSLGIGIVVYKFVKEWQKSETAAFWALVFTYFSTSWGWLISWIRYKDIGGESMFWAQQSLSTLLNPPFALSLLLLFAGLWCMLKKQNRYAMVCFGLLGFVKIYAGLLLLGALFMSAIYEFVKNGNRRWLVVWVGAFVISILFFFPLNKSSGKVIVWQPGWFLETMMAVSDRANWPKYYEAMINYRAGHNFIKGIPAYGVALLIFILGNLGLRILGLGAIIKSKFNSMELLFTSIIAAGFILPMCFLQTGTPWNTIQFTYYSLVLSGILAGVYVSKINKPVASLIIFSGLSVFGMWGTLKNYLPARPPAMISTLELDALKFLRNESPGVVLTPLFDPVAAKAAEANPPRPLYLYESSAYVSALTSKKTFLEDQVNLNITNFPWQDRVEITKIIFTSLDTKTVKDLIENNHIKYIYTLNVPNGRPNIGPALIGAKTIFENSEALIWKID